MQREPRKFEYPFFCIPNEETEPEKYAAVMEYLEERRERIERGEITASEY